MSWQMGKSIIAFCIASAGLTAVAAEDIQIDNQFGYLAKQAVWGTVYVGKYTEGNGLHVRPWVDVDGEYNNSSLSTDDAYIGFTDTAHGNVARIYGNADTNASPFEATWVTKNLTIGTEANSNNVVMLGWFPGTAAASGLTNIGIGTLEILDSLVINGTSNGNMLTVMDLAKLKIHSDFDMTMDGFYFIGSNATLSVGGELSGLQDLDGGYQTIELFGMDASWSPSNSTTVIGATTHSNTLSLVEGASLSLSNLTIGAANTTNNSAVVTGGASLSILDSLNIAGSASNSNSLQIIDGGILNLYTDYTHSGNLTNMSSGINLSGGTANFYENVTAANGWLVDNSSINLMGATNDITALEGSGSVVLSGQGNIWESTELLISTLAEDQFPTNSEVGPGQITVRVQDGTVLRVGHFSLGGTNDVEGNTMVIEDGGKLVLTGVSANSRHSKKNPLILESGSWITYEQDADPGDAEDGFSSGVTYEFMSDGFIHDGVDMDEYAYWGYYSARNQRTYIFNGELNGAAARLNIGGDNLHIGDIDGGNTLIFTNGASGIANSLSIGDFQEGGHDNRVIISGDGSTFTSLSHVAIGGTIIDNMWHEGGNGNILRVEDGGLLTATKLYNRNASGSSGLEIGSGAEVSVDEYYQGAGAKLVFLADSSGSSNGLLQADTAEFEAGALVGVDAIAKLITDQQYTNTVIQANALIIDGVTNGTSLAALGTAGGSLVNYNLDLIDGTNVVAMYSRRSISNAGGFDPDTIISEISDEIDTMASLGNTAASNQVEILNTMTDAQVNAQMEQLYVYGLPTFMHNQGMLGGIEQVRARGCSAMESGYYPRGAGGPGVHAEDQGYQLWLKTYGGFGNRDQEGSFDNGYDVQAFGTILGVDKAFGELLFGLAGGLGNSMLKGDNGDESDASTGFGMFYTSYSKDNWFVDFIFSQGFTSMDNTSGTAFDTKSSTDASQSIAYLGFGAEVDDTKSGSVLRPLAGLQISLYDQDAYTEDSTTAVGKDVEAYDRMSYQTTLGAEMVVPSNNFAFDFETQTRAYWIHEFNADDEFINYTLADSSQPGKFVMRAPESDMFQLGIGCAARWLNGLQLRADLDGLISKNYYSATLSGAILYEF